MGNKTVKRLAILIVAVVIVGGTGYLFWSFQVSRLARGVVAQADRAVSEGDFVEAERLYREYLAVLDEQDESRAEIRQKYAEVLLKLESTQRRDEALSILDDILRQYPGKDDVRRRAAEIAVEIGGAATEKARGYLASLLRRTPDDGHLEYLMGRCYDQDGDATSAEKSYASAIDHKAPEQLEAAGRRATLLRDSLGRKDEADKAIDAMVASSPKDYRAYLGRGQYREGAATRVKGEGKAAAGGVDDFRKAIELAPDHAELYLELARAVERQAGGTATGLDAARQVLDRGLAAVPKASSLYLALASIEQRSGRFDRAAEALELGLKALPSDLNLRWQLAINLANRGESESAGLRLQIAELERLEAPRPLIQYLQAFDHYNHREFRDARRILTAMLPTIVRMGNFRGVVNALLARCYAETNEVEQQQEAALRALSINPGDLMARQNYIQALIARGDVEEGIRQYRELYAQQPAVARIPLAALLMTQVRRQPAASRNWTEVQKLLDEAAAANPDALEVMLLRAQLLAEQGQESRADDLLETARARAPSDIRPWIALVESRIRRQRLDEAQSILDRARQEVGDRFEFRLTGISLALARGGEAARTALEKLGQGIDNFPREGRRQILTSIATELDRLGDPATVAAWERLLREDPQNLQPRLRLFEIAMAAGDADRATARLHDIELIDPESAAFARSQFLAWRARNEADLAARRKLRDQAHALLDELRLRRPDMARVPLALARLNEEEAADAPSDDARREKTEAALAAYRLAVDLGLRDPIVLRGYIQLLFRSGQGAEALRFYSELPQTGAYTGDLGRVASKLALANRDVQKAEEIARKAVETDPSDFQSRVWLAQLLLEHNGADEAISVIRRGLADAPDDPNRHIILVRFLILARRTEQAEQAAREAEVRLAPKPTAVAQCCAIVGKAYEVVDPDRSRTWYGRARSWYDRAQRELKDPTDLSVKRLLAQFLVETNQPAEAEPVLKEILDQSASKSPTTASSARRALAQLYVNASPPRIADAVALYPSATGPGANPDDLRILSQIHEIQGTPESRKLAAAELETLIAQEGAATLDDRRRFAQLLEAIGDWPRAREQFQELTLRAEAAKDPEAVARRPLYYTLAVEALVRHHRPGDDSDLDQARKLVDKLRPIQREPLVPLLLEAEIDRAAGQIDAASDRIRKFDARPDLTPNGRLRLALEAERLGLFDAADAVYRHVATLPSPDPKATSPQLPLALFLARRGRIVDAVNLCESLRSDPAQREIAGAIAVQVVCDSAHPLNLDQVRRVLAWYQGATPGGEYRSVNPVLCLGNLYERMGDYTRAEEAYRRVVQSNDAEGIASNNLAWLLALRGGRGLEALDLVNKAIRVRGALPEFLDTRGVIYLKMGEKRRALSDLEATARASASASKFFHLAEAYLSLDEMEKARKALEAGKSRGLPAGLHVLELADYRKIAGQLGAP